MQARIGEWQRGESEPPSFDEDVSRARRAFASLVRCASTDVAVVSQTATVSGLVASSLPAGARVLVAQEDFTSVLFPFLADPRLQVRAVPLASLLDEIGPGVDLIAVSAVQSADGRVLDLDQLARAASAVGARTYVDATQAAGWLPFDATHFDVTACSAYKWLCCPKGVAFLTTRRDAREWLLPRFANWYGAEDRWTGIYGPPLRLADDARRYDLSPPWLCWAAAAPTLEKLAALQVESIHEHNTKLATSLLQRLGLPSSKAPSAIVSLAQPNAFERLRAAGIRCAGRAGRTRLSFHLYSTAADVDAVVEALL
ncbi:MAG TPA: aminotransferase class V-fold PLP-dependent enzyme [Polyangiales bacterium]|nr:aminotransferase class V-fold PLP-dependent enzyme [Polyangiales bacterium]